MSLQKGWIEMARKIPERPQVYQLKVTMKGIKPLIWRRILVSGDINLYKLHKVLQVIMGWENYHLHIFELDGITYAIPSPEDPWPMETKNEKRARLNDVLPEEQDRMEYVYDLGDNWHHAIVVEKILSSDEGLERPVCLDGKRSAPPEDCGGVGGYEDFCKAIINPRHPEHDYLLKWVGGEFDPERFDLDEANRLLSKIR
jgi:hypothetical protein